MATIHISEADAARDFARLLARAAGAEIVIENGASSPVVLRVAGEPAARLPSESLRPTREHRAIVECIAMLPEDSMAVIDREFVRDVEAGIAFHREPLNPPAWN